MGKPARNLEEINKITDLRKNGHTIPEISSLLNIPKTTVYRYASKTEILPKYQEIWKIKRGGSTKRMILAQDKAYLEGKNLVKKLSSKERQLFLSSLYWAEGSKKDFGLSNSDPHLISVFTNILEQEFNIVKSDLRISIRTYEDLDKDACLEFWSKVVGIPKEEFVSVNVLSGKKVGKLKYGMCRVRVVKGGSLLKRIQGINKAIVECFSIIP
jgi:hypothetical protein